MVVDIGNISDPVLKEILLKLKGMYDISYELGKEAFDLIKEYDSQRNYEKIRAEVAKESSEDGKIIDLKEYQRKITLKQICEYTKTLKW